MSTLARVGRGRGAVLAAAAAAAALLPTVGVADVTFDGSLGRPGTLAGRAVLVPADRGQQRGGNLFHSFSKFDVARGQAVTFTGPAAATNVIARVTGGAVSTINGTLASDIAGANLFLVNPAGVVFGKNASLSLGGSLAVATADELRLVDGTAFAASAAAPSAGLGSSPPAAFGFLGGGAIGGGAGRASVIVRGPRLTLAPGRVLSLIGGDVAITADRSGVDPIRSFVTAGAGRINLVAVGDAGTVELDATTPASKLRVRGAPALGDVAVSGGARVSVDGEAGGRIEARAARMTVEGSRVTANTLGGGDGAGIDISLTEQFTLSIRGGVFSDTVGTGNAGKVSLSAPRVDISSARVEGFEFSGLASFTRGSPAAAAGGPRAPAPAAAAT